MTTHQEMLTRPVEKNGRHDAAIWTQDLSRKFGDEVVVDNLTLNVPKGKIFGFIGPSGSGKTTTVRMLTGTYRPTSGEVSVLGFAPSKFSQALRRRIGYMPQLFVLYPELSVIENLNFAASLYGMSLRRGKRLAEVLDFVELSEHKRKQVRDISGGMQRRLSLATTLVHNPELLFLDEPTAGIDPILRNKFWEHFRQLADAGHTLFITTQYVSEAAYCDLVGVLSDGRLRRIDTPENLRRRAFGCDIINIRVREPLATSHLVDLKNLPFVQGQPIAISSTELRLIVDEGATDLPHLVDWSKERGLAFDAIEEYMPPFDEVFVKIITETNGE
jgi:ABC-2 type transport system ATP-binding protein